MFIWKQIGPERYFLPLHSLQCRTYYRNELQVSWNELMCLEKWKEQLLMLIKAILHGAQKWYPKQPSPEGSGQWTGPGRSWLVSRNTLLLMANSSPPLEVPISVVARTQSEPIRRGQVRKHEGNEHSFDPCISNKWVWSCFPPLEGEPEPRNSQRRDELNLGGPQSKPSSKQKRKQVPSSKGNDSALALPQVCKGWPYQTCRAGLLCGVPHG